MRAISKLLDKLHWPVFVLPFLVYMLIGSVEPKLAAGEDTVNGGWFGRGPGEGDVGGCLWGYSAP